MKVLMINGSSRNNGCTRAALDIMTETFKEEGIETEIIFIGNQPIADCMNCKKCVTEHQCVFDDVVNEITTKAKDCDGFIFASPVYYAHPSARLLAVLDRAFYSNKSVFVYKPGACTLVQDVLDRWQAWMLSTNISASLICLLYLPIIGMKSLEVNLKMFIKMQKVLRLCRISPKI